MLRHVAGGSPGSDTLVSTGNTFQVPGEEPEEVEHDRGFEAVPGLLEGEGDGSVAPTSGLPAEPSHRFPLPGHSPSSGHPGAGAASGGGGPGAWGLLWAELGPVGRGGWC